jgi:hypothetical protein
MAEKKPLHAALTKSKTHVLLAMGEWRFRATLVEFDRMVELHLVLSDPKRCKFPEQYTDDLATLNKMAEQIKGLPR